MLELFVVHTNAGKATFVQAHGATVEASGALLFKVRAAPLARRKAVAVFAPGQWSAYHLANAYYDSQPYTGEPVAVRVDADAIGRALNP